MASATTTEQEASRCVSDFVPITTDEVDGATGRIFINKLGQVFVNSDPDHSLAAAEFTSFAGVNYTLPY